VIVIDSSAFSKPLMKEEGWEKVIPYLNPARAFNSKTEAFTKALRLLVRKYKANQLRGQIEKIREGTESLPSVTEAVIKAHEEEDLPAKL